MSVEVREEVGSVEEGLKTKKVKFENTGNADVFKKWKDLLRNEKSEK